MEEDLRRLQLMFRRQKSLDMRTLGGRFPSRSRRSLFRDLARLQYLTSYSHAGRFYTLADFDELGLWFFRDIGFSQAGTLKQTVAIEVEEAPDGRTHSDLRHLLGVRVHNTLLGLVREGRVAREPFAGRHLYLSADAERAAQQMARRTEGVGVVTGALRAPTSEETMEILVEALRAAPQVPEAALVAKRLAARGLRVEGRHVQQVFEAHGLQPGKKTAPPSSRPSRR